MRIWMDPTELNKYQLTPVDVITAIKAQNARVAAGQLGGTPPVKGQQLNASIIAQTRLTSTEEFGKILLKVNQDGSRVRLSDVARIELGGENYDVIAKFNGQPASGLGSNWQQVQTRWILQTQYARQLQNWSLSSRTV